MKLTTLLSLDDKEILLYIIHKTMRSVCNKNISLFHANSALSFLAM